MPTPKSLTPHTAPLLIPELASELASVVGYKHLLMLAGQENYPEVFAEADKLLITLFNNLRESVCAIHANKLGEILDLLPVSQLACVISVLLMEESEFPNPFEERLPMVYHLISKLVSLLPDEDLHSETSELANQLISIPGTDEASFVAKADMSLGIASPLCYGSIYLPTQATTQLPTPQVDTH
jgi:hypothetical protein